MIPTYSPLDRKGKIAANLARREHDRELAELRAIAASWHQDADLAAAWCDYQLGTAIEFERYCAEKFGDDEKEARRLGLPSKRKIRIPM
jgi:hypothetical protein